MRCWGELKSLRGQSVGKVRLVMRAIFRICGNQSQPGLQIVEKLATPLPGNDRSSGCARVWLPYPHILDFFIFYSPLSSTLELKPCRGQQRTVAISMSKSRVTAKRKTWGITWLKIRMNFYVQFQFPLWVEGYKARVSSSYFSLFFEHIPIFSYFKTKSSYFSCFLAGEAKICNKIENGIIVLCSLEWDWS